MDRKIKGLIWGDQVIKTGFERVIYSIFSRLTDKLDIVGLGINHHGDPHKYPYPVFPASNGGDIYGIGRIGEFVKDNLDFIFILNDVWVIDKFLDAIKKAWDKTPLPKIIVYFPVDAEEHSSEWYKNFDIVDIPVTYTEFGRNVVLKAAPELKDKLKIIPHGTDIEMFSPMYRQEARKKLFGDRNKDDFIFLNANRNQPRKKLDVTMEAFKLFSDGKPDTRLYLHCGITDMGIDVGRLSVRLGIDNKLILSNLARGPQQVSERQLNLIYNCCDVGVNTGLGEGWSLTNAEHMCTGAPQIVPDHSACRELFSDCGLLVPTKLPWTFDNIMTVGRQVDAVDVATAMETIYTDKDLYNNLSEKGLKKFTSQEYNWDFVANKWLKLIEEPHDTDRMAFTNATKQLP